MIVPALLALAGTAAVAYAVLASSHDGPVPDHRPDSAAVPGKTGYRRIDALLPKLRAISSATDIPLGLLVGDSSKDTC